MNGGAARRQAAAAAAGGTLRLLGPALPEEEGAGDEQQERRRGRQDNGPCALRLRAIRRPMDRSETDGVQSAYATVRQAMRSSAQRRPGVASGSMARPLATSRAASRASAVSGRSARGKRVRPACAAPPSDRQHGAQSAPSSRRPAHRAVPPRPASASSAPSSRAAIANSIAPRCGDSRSTSRLLVEQGRPAIFQPGQHRAGHAARQQARPRRPAAAARAAAGCASSRSSASRHQASLIAPSAGWVEDATTSASASSIANRASKAGRELDRPVEPDEVAVPSAQR